LKPTVERWRLIATRDEVKIRNTVESVKLCVFYAFSIMRFLFVKTR
jgi:hypothetical protein